MYINESLITFCVGPAQVEDITVLNSNSSSLTVGWAVPLGHVDSYMVNVSGAELNRSLTYTPPINSSVISNLMAGRVYNLTVTTSSGVLKNSSNIVLVATSESENFTHSPSPSPLHQTQPYLCRTIMYLCVIFPFRA